MEINLSLYLPGQKIPYGQFTLPDELDVNVALKALKGSPSPKTPCSIEMEIIRNVVDLPIPVDIRYCTLKEIKENTAIIAKEVFRIAHLHNEHQPGGHNLD